MMDAEKWPRRFAAMVAFLSAACGSQQAPPGKYDPGLPPITRETGSVPCSGVYAGDTSASEPSDIQKSFRWTSSEPLASPLADAAHPILSVKDPSIVCFEGRWHLFATTADERGAWSMVTMTFADFKDAATAKTHYLGDRPALAGYHAAPQVFYFRPQKRWYLIFQSGQPQYSTTETIDDPDSWTKPVDFFAEEPQTVKNTKGQGGGWLDFWVICDEARCHLFFTDDNGHFYRSQTDISRFPQGFGEPVVAISDTKGNLFEGSSTYRVRGTNRFLTLIEAFGPKGERYYRAFTADKLDGAWTPLAGDWENPFAGARNVTFPNGGAWTEQVSHGELLRAGYDETLTVSLRDLRFLYQGADPTQTNVEYFRLPYRLALLTHGP